MTLESEMGERLASLLDGLVIQHRQGNHAALEECCAHDPDVAEQLRELFPAMIVLEQHKPEAQAKVFAGYSFASASGLKDRCLAEATGFANSRHDRRPKSRVVMLRWHPSQENSLAIAASLHNALASVPGEFVGN